MARSLAGVLAAELGNISADEVAAELRSWADQRRAQARPAIRFVALRLG